MAIGGAAAPAFTPADLTGIIDYGIGTGITTPDVDGIYEWQGELGDMIFGQSTGSKKPQLTAGGSPGGNDMATFDGVDDVLSTSDALGQFTSSPVAQPFTVSALVRWAGFPSSVDIVFSGANAGTRFLGVTAGGLWNLNFGTSQVGSAPSTGTWYRLIAHLDAGNSYLDINEANDISANCGANNLNGMKLAEDFSTTNHGAIDIAAWVVTSVAPTGDEKTDLWAWLGDQ